MLKQLTNRRQFWTITVAVVLLLAIGGVIALRTWYTQNLKPVSSASATVFFTIEPGSGAHQIALNLKNAGLIRSVSAFETYLTANDVRDKLQAGTYKLSPSLSTQAIVTKMVEGDVAKNLLTILPGKHLAQIKEAFAKAGYSDTEIEAVFNPANYAGHPALASLPRGASLEGYMYPESFQKDSNTPADAIVRQSLDQMQKRLTNELTDAFARQNLNTYQAVTLASIVLKETDDVNDMPVVAQVLLTRLARGMLLQADATAHYASDIAGTARSLQIESPYNTYKHKGLPPGPISNVTIEVLRAVANPASTDYLFYVTGDDGKTRFSHTQAEHEENVARYCHKRCQ